MLAIAGDAIVVLNPREEPEIPPVVELIDIEPMLQPPPPPVEPEPEPEPEIKEPQKPVEKTVQKQPRTAPPPPTNQPPPPDNSGGAPVTTMENIAPDALGTVPVAVGKPTSGKVGRGGTGTGTGAGSGAGSSDEPPKPVSIATIKKLAMPKGDFSYFDASKDYPAEAKSLGIEGVIRARLVVDDQGKVKSVVLLNKLGHGLDELALERAKKIVFEPARDSDDKPVASVLVWTFNMTLPK